MSSIERLLGVLIGLSFLVFTTSPAHAGNGEASVGLSPIGVWATENGFSHVKITDCDGKLCGSIIWLKEPLNKEGKDKIDSKNPDPRLQSRKMVGLQLLKGFVSDGDSAVWSGGTIYNPDDGK